MADWKKRVTKERSNDLRPDEELVDACFFQGRGTLRSMLKFAVVKEVSPFSDGIAQQHAASAMQKAFQEGQAENIAPEGSLAAQIPDDKGVIAFTTMRLLVFRYKQGTFKTKIEDLVLEIPRHELVDWQYQSGKATSLFGLTFGDGSSIAIELPRLNKPDDFARAVGAPFVEE